MTNIYDNQFEEYLVLDLGFDLDTVTLPQVMKALKQFNNL